MQEGFRYHHAEPAYLMLVYWIPDTKCTLPANATHRVGVGAFVMNDKGEVIPEFAPPPTFELFVISYPVILHKLVASFLHHKVIDDGVQLVNDS